MAASLMTLKYEPSLDGLRATAALAVILFHEALLPGGFMGVDVFFVLSGYLISSIVLAELRETEQFRLGRFFARRARRLLPALALLLVVYAALVERLLPHNARWLNLDLFLASTQTMNFAEAYARRRTGISHTWTLAIEWQFYLIWPLFMLGLARLKDLSAARVIFTAWALLTLGRLAWLAAGGSPILANYLPVFHLTGLLLGSALAFYRPSVRLGWLGVAVMLYAAVFGPVMGDATMLPLLEISTGLAIAAPPAFLATPTLVRLGKISYGIYLWHFPIWLSLWHNVPEPWRPAVYPLEFVLTILAATISYLCVERWFLKGRPWASPPQMQGALIAVQDDGRVVRP